MNDQGTVKSCIPTLEVVGLWRINTPNDPHFAWYGDSEIFTRHRKLARRLILRAAHWQEFDGDFQGETPPQLWILVVELTNGTHMTVPVWRGRPFFPVGMQGVAAVGTDGEVAAIVCEMRRRGGCDPVELSAWEQNPSNHKPKP